MKDAGLLTEPELARLLRLINTTTELAKALEHADIVVEAVSESPKVKASVFLQIAELAPASAAVWSNTSSLDVFELAPPQIQNRLLIAHWFAPPHILPLVELVKGDMTEEVYITGATQLLANMGKTPVMIDRYVPGFIINRLLRVLGREADRKSTRLNSSH